MPIPLADLHLVLARQLQRRLNRFRPNGGEVDRSTSKTFAGKIKQLLRKFFGNPSRELAGMDKLQLLSLLRHSVGNFANAVTNKIHRRRSREVHVAIVVAIPDVNTFAPNGQGIRLKE